jgi:hypothetical protein
VAWRIQGRKTDFTQRKAPAKAGAFLSDEKNFFQGFGTERSFKLRFVCADMGRPYLQIVAEMAG